MSEVRWVGNRAFCASSAKPKRAGALAGMPNRYPMCDGACVRDGTLTSESLFDGRFGKLMDAYDMDSHRSVPYRLGRHGA